MSTRMIDVDLARWRVPGAGMLAAGAVLALLPEHPGLPCPLRTFTGIPCPLCGMTTSVEATLTGRMDDAVEANPMGIVAVAAAAWLLVATRPPRVRVPAAVIAVTVAAMWVFELFRFSVI